MSSLEKECKHDLKSCRPILLLTSKSSKGLFRCNKHMRSMELTWLNEARAFSVCSVSWWLHDSCGCIQSNYLWDESLFPLISLKTGMQGSYNVLPFLCVVFNSCLFGVYLCRTYLQNLRDSKWYTFFQSPWWRIFALIVPSVDASNSWFQLAHLLVSCTPTKYGLIFETKSHTAIH